MTSEDWKQGAAVLKQLHELAGKPSYDEIVSSCQRRGDLLGKGTITSLLAGDRQPRSRSVQRFAQACLDLDQKRRPPQLRDEQRALEHWIRAYDDAVGGPQSKHSSEMESGGMVRVGILPVQANAFQLRSIDAGVEDAVSAGKAVVLTQVLSGLGGVGKTQIAAHYAREQWDNPDTYLIIWVSAVSPTSIITSYAQAAAHVLDMHSSDPEQAAQQLMAWLSTTPKSWLVVLDDLHNPADLTGWRPPVTLTGQVVLTTRYRGDALRRHDTRLVQVDVFTEAEVVAYLHARLDSHSNLLSSTDSSAEVASLAADLGYLPLALAQATAYMINENMPASQYRQLFADTRRALAEMFPDRAELPDEHRDTVAVTWTVSIDRANSTQPAGLARPLLQVASLLDSNGIPNAVFTTEAIRNYFTELLATEVDIHAISRGLNLLHRYNLATIDPDHKTASVHGLVQRATRDALSRAPSVTDPDYGDLTYAVADSLVDAWRADGRLEEVWPNFERDVSLVPTLRANAVTLIKHGEAHLWDEDSETLDEHSKVHPLLVIVGVSLTHSGLLEQAIAHYQHLCTTASDHFGGDDLDTFGLRGELGYALSRAGKLSEATEQFETLLKDQMRVLGSDHPFTMTSRNYLARLRGQSGDTKGAVAEAEWLLADRLRVLGPDHLSTFSTRATIAMFRGYAGEIDVAIAQFEALLADQLRAFGPDHGETLGTRHNLAKWRGVSGDWAGALAEAESLLAAQQRLLDADHPDIIDSRNNIAVMRGEGGDAVGAAVELGSLFDDAIRVLGPEHPEALAIRHNLIVWRKEAGNEANALGQLESLQADQRRILGPSHPHAITTRDILAAWRQEAGNV